LGNVLSPGLGSWALPLLRSGHADGRFSRWPFARFLEQLEGWVDGPPVIEQLDVVGSYNLFEAQREESAVR
jgi:hypothetical protein